MKSMIRKMIGWLGAWLPPFIVMGVIFMLSSRQSISVSDEMAVNFSIFKTLHVLEYGLLTFLFFRALYFTTKMLHNKMIGLSGSLSLLYGISDEIHQTYVPTRTGQPRDVLIDLIGILFVAILLYKRRDHIKKLLSYTTF